MARITRAQLEKRLDQLAREMRCCPTHGTKLWCPCADEWTGTEAEWIEVEMFMDRINPSLQDLEPTNIPCATCGDRAWCEACCSEQLDDAEPDLLTPEEEERFQLLMALMQPKSPGRRTTTYPWQAPTPPAEPVPIPVSAPAVSIPILVQQAPVTEDDDNIDAELTEIVAAIKARLR